MSSWQSQISWAWVIAVVAVSYSLGTASPMRWALVATVSLIVPILIWRFWPRLEPSTSESIRDVLR